MPAQPDANQIGFTLIECIVTLSVASALLVVAMPAFGSLIRSARVNAALSGLSGDLALARISAISRNTSYVVCPSNDGANCVNDGDWSGGWIGFHDRDRDLAPPIGEGPTSARQRDPSHLRIVSNTGRPYVRYLPDGQSPGTNLTIRICNGAIEAARVVVNNAGRIRTQRAKTPAPCPA